MKHNILVISSTNATRGQRRRVKEEWGRSVTKISDKYPNYNSILK